MIFSKERYKIRIIKSNVNIILNFGKILIQKNTLLWISLFVILMIGCDSQSKVTYSSEEIINISKIFVNQSKTFEFTLTHSNGYTLLPGNLNISKAKGKIQKPNKILIDAEIISNDFLLKLSYLTFDENDNHFIILDKYIELMNNILNSNKLIYITNINFFCSCK